MDLTANLKAYFCQKKNSNKTVTELSSPNSWGMFEYDGMHYTIIKGQKNNPKKEIYNNFIADVARKLDKVTVRKDAFVCQSC